MTSADACAPDAPAAHDAAQEAEADAGEEGGLGSNPVSDAGAADVDLDALFNVYPPDPYGAAYLGGPILTGTVSVYMLWYGDWSGSPAPAILEDLLRGLSGDAYDDASTYDGILRAYYEQDPDGGQAHASGRFQFAGSFFVGYTSGSSLTLGSEENVVANAITYGIAPYDPAGIYVLASSSDVEQDLGPSAGFCETYCAFHRPGLTNTTEHLPFYYVFAGNPMRCPDLCTLRPQFEQIGLTQSPNGDWGADGIASHIVHELFESVTDPRPYSGWVDPFNRAEIGDMCAWRFDPTFPCDDGGSRANVTWGDRNYLIQQMWVLDDAGGHCGLTP